MNEPKNGPAQAQNEIAKFSEEEKVERLERTAQDMKWLLDSEDELRTQYLHKYIAIKNKKVVFSADTPEEMVTKTLAAGENLNDLLCGYMDKGPRLAAH
jgi:hypothetical protein